MEGVIVKPFIGYLPSTQKIAEIVAPPYDVLDRNEALEIGTEKPDSIIHITRPEIDFPETVKSTEDEVYKKGASNLRKWIEKNLLVKDEKPAFYICSQKLGDHEQFGLYALCSCEQYGQGIIKKHEQTRKVPELDRTITTKVQNANVESVFLSYSNEKNSELNDYIKSLATGKPDREAHLDFDNTAHKIWIVNDEEKIQKIENMFRKIDYLYIADGHHRSASAYNVYKERKEEAGDNFKGDEPFCYFLAAIFSDSELCVIDYNRVITGVKTPRDEILEKIRQQGFEVHELKGDETPKTHSFIEFHYARPVEKHTFSLYMQGKWFSLKFTGKYKSDNPVDQIDSKILTDFVLTPLFGIVDLRAATNIKFFGGTRGLKELEEQCKDPENIAIAVPPITLQQLFEVSNSGDMMPPKSTWFVPKLASGMICRLVE